MNRIIGMIGTTIGGGMVGAGIQRTYLVGNKLASGLSKLTGKGGMKFDRTTWVLLICGLIVLASGVYYSNKKN